MICAECGQPTPTEPCAGCGADPHLAGRWRLDAELGRGASGTTFRATDLETGEVVAVKEMPIGRASSAKARELLDREARVLGELDHPAIPRLLASRVVGEGRSQAVIVVQEFVDGVDLRAELVKRRYDPLEVLHVAADLLDVLVYLHGLSPPVIHRDLKPANVMRRTDGRLVLLDFGSVRDSLRDLDLGGSTVAGTFGYMAPEQLVGDASPMSDLYGLGALMVHLLSRIEPQKMLAVGGGLAWEGRVQVPRGVGDLLRDLLEPDPDRRAARLRSTAAVRDRVMSLIEGRVEGAVVGPVAVPAGQSAAAVGFGAGAFAAMLGLGILGLVGSGAVTGVLLSPSTVPVPPPVVRDLPPPPPPPPPIPAPDPAFVDVGLGDLPPIGPADAPVKIVAFSDYQCPYCVKALTQLDDLVLRREGQVALYLRDFPLEPMHPEARSRARAARCAGAQGRHAEMHDGMLALGARFEPQAIWTLARELALDLGAFEGCLVDPAVDARIDADLAAGREAGVTGTPAFYVNGEVMRGAQPMEKFDAAIDRALERLRR
jgi:serine/threonine protein kinase/predicted DsbA family dithiol-disulfide isomerase